MSSGQLIDNGQIFFSVSIVYTPPIEESVLQSGVHMAHDLRR